MRSRLGAGVPSNTDVPSGVWSLREATNRRIEDVWPQRMPELPSYTEAVIEDSPIGYWRLGESSGDTAADELGALPGTYVGSVTLDVPGALANDDDTAAQLAQGSDTSYPRIRWSSVSWIPTGDYCFEIWGKKDNADNAGLWSYALSSANNEILLFVRDTTTTFYADASVGDFSHKDIADGEWHHFALVKLGSDVTLFIDGEEVGTLSSSYTISTGGTLVIGQEQDSVDGGYDTAQAWIGSVDEVAIYDHALSQSRIAHHYDVGRGL